MDQFYGEAFHEETIETNVSLESRLLIPWGEKTNGLPAQSVRCEKGRPWDHQMRLAIILPICDDIAWCRFNPIP